MHHFASLTLNINKNEALLHFQFMQIIVVLCAKILSLVYHPSLNTVIQLSDVVFGVLKVSDN